MPIRSNSIPPPAKGRVGWGSMACAERERPAFAARGPRVKSPRTARSLARTLASFVLGRPGGFSGGPVPDPISNSAVKLPTADGTKAQDLEEEVAARPAKDE